MEVIDMTELENRLKLAALLILYMFVSFMSMVLLVVHPLKMLLGRERPSHLPQKNRWCNMRAREKGKSLPSGDAAACAFIATVYL